MKKKHILIFSAVVSVFILGFIVLRIVAKEPGSDPRSQIMPLVKVEKPLREDVVYKLTFNGDVLAYTQANIFSKVSGTLERVYADMGDFVREGQLLALLDSTELFQQFQQSAATYENARVNYERTKELLGQNLVAKQELDNAETAFKVARANYENAKTRLSYTQIRAPFTGYITRRFLDPGVFVSASSGQASSTSTLFTIMDLRKVKVIVNVLERDVVLLDRIKKAVVTVDAYPSKTFFGVVKRISQAVDVNTRTMSVEVDVENVESLLKPGMFAAVDLIVDEHPQALTLPEQAVMMDEKGTFVYDVEQGKAHRIPVEIGIRQKNKIEILRGLFGSEDIVVAGQQQLHDTAQVKVVQ